jgi:type IV secretion system protein VirB5
MTQIAARIASLAQLEASIQSQPDVTAVAAVNARINAEHAYLANESNNVSNLRLLQQSQATVDQQRAEQHDRQQAEQWGSASSVQAGW